MDDLCYLSAADAARLFRTGDLSPVTLMEAILDRADQTEPAINALTYRFDDAAMASAERAARKFATGTSARALEGLPVAIKDAGHVKGQITSGGSLLSNPQPQPATSPINAKILRAGAICHARSATPEFSCASVTWSNRWGITRNPWNPDYTPGGSSGGAGAALAAGSTTLASGSDIGGSIRIPAACCGVVGYKPPRGRNAVDPPFNLDSYCHTGPMARTVGDALLFQNAMSGPHPADPTTLHPKHTIRALNTGLAGIRIAWSEDLGFFEVDNAVRARFRDALQVFADLGATLEEVAIPWDWDVIEAGLTHLRHLFGTSLAPLLGQGDRMTDYARAFAQAGLQITPEAHFASLTKVGAMGQDFAHLFRAADFFLCPTNAIPAVPAGFDPERDSVEINGKWVDPMLGWVMTLPFNMLSHHPVLSVPMGRAPTGVPTGLQIVGRAYRDADVFKAGLAYEAAVGGWYKTAPQRPDI